MSETICIIERVSFKSVNLLQSSYVRIHTRAHSHTRTQVHTHTHTCVHVHRACVCSRRRQSVDGYCDISISRENFSSEHLIIIKPRPLPPPPPPSTTDILMSWFYEGCTIILICIYCIPCSANDYNNNNNNAYFVIGFFVNARAFV